MRLQIVSAPLLLPLLLASCQSARGEVMGFGEDNRFFIQLVPPPPQSMATIVGQGFIIRPDTVVTLDDQSVRLTDLPRGTPVVVIYDPSSKVAKTIRATRSKSDRELIE